MLQKPIFITAIHTDSGKTVASALIALHLQADYWKPIQAGTPTDTQQISDWSENSIIFHPEKYVLKHPESPHSSAKKERIELSLDDFTLPSTQNLLVIEGAGGVMVPINDHHFIIDLAAKWDCEVILVSNPYLGSINHTLLSAAYLKSRNIHCKGIIFNGLHESSQSIILKKTGLKLLFTLPRFDKITKQILLSFPFPFDEF